MHYTGISTYHIISSFRTMPVLYPRTHIRKPFEDSELMGLKEETAEKASRKQITIMPGEAVCLLKDSRQGRRRDRGTGSNPQQPAAGSVADSYAHTHHTHPQASHFKGDGSFSCAW